MTPSLPRLHLLVLLAAATLTACTVGPDYQGPPDAAPMAAKANAFHRAATADAIAADPPARWWEALQDPLLNRLIETALRRSPTVQQDEARLRNARATVSEQRAGLFPSGGPNALAVRTQLPTSGLSSLSSGGSGGNTSSASAGATSITTNLFDAGFDASWEIDIFGGTRRAIESAAPTPAHRRRNLRTRRCNSPPKWHRPISTCETPSTG
jgi:outer membrane protein TolC